MHRRPPPHGARTSQRPVLEWVCLHGPRKTTPSARGGGELATVCSARASARTACGMARCQGTCALTLAPSSSARRCATLTSRTVASMSSRNVCLQSAVRATACSSWRRRRQGAQALLGARLTRVDARFCFERREGRTRRGCIWASKWGLHSLGRDVSEGAPVLPRPPRAIHQTRPPLDVDCRGQARNSPRLRQSPPQPSPMAAPRLTPVAQLMVAPAALSRSPQPYCTGRVAPMFVCTDCLALALPGKRRRCAAMLCTGDAQVVAQSPFLFLF